MCVQPAHEGAAASRAESACRTTPPRLSSRSRPGVLAVADIDIFTTSTTLTILQSLRLDLEPSSQGPPLTRTPGAGERRPWCGAWNLAA